MRILINKSQQEAERYSLLSSCQIVPLTDKTQRQDVIALIESDNFPVSLKEALSYNIPIVAITTKGTEQYNQALKLIHPAAVVYYENGQILSSEKVFAEAPGINIKILEEICQYALKNKLYPDIYIWKPQDVSQDYIWKENKQEQPVKPEKTARSQKVTPAQTDLKTYIGSCDRIIAVFKASSSADSSNIASRLAKQLNTVHLNISINPEQKQNPCYAYSDGNMVNYNSSNMPGQYLVAEVDAQIPEALELIYGVAYKIVHVVADPNESIGPLSVWLSSGFKLDAVIPNQTKDIPAYSEFPVYSVEDFVKTL